MARQSPFHSIKFIDGDPSLNNSDFLKTANMVMDPVKDMLEVEEWEARLERNKVPYVLAQVEMTLSKPIRYSRGYVLFTQNGGIG